eukprot:scaffold86939_cov32-Tisochrysis_lutea.AAC.3
MKACKEQFLSFCGTGGGADVLDDASLLTCLRESRDSFTGACRQKTFAVERMAHAEMDFNAEASTHPPGIGPLGCAPAACTSLCKPCLVHVSRVPLRSPRHVPSNFALDAAE